MLCTSAEMFLVTDYRYSLIPVQDVEFGSFGVELYESDAADSVRGGDLG